MKAEHRKELQTNALADRMGRFIKRVKQRPSRGWMLTVLLAILVLGAGAFYLWRRSAGVEEAAQLWDRFGRLDYQTERGSNYEDLRRLTNNVGRAAAAQKAWFYLHEGGLRRLLEPPFQADRQTPTALEFLEVAEGIYKELAPSVKDDPILAPEVQYALAVIAETRAIDLGVKAQLDKAARLYDGVARDFENSGSALAKRARKRHKELTDPTQRQEIDRFYEQLREQAQLMIHIRDLHRQQQQRKKD